MGKQNTKKNTSQKNKNESIINWELHQKLIEKKFGKKPLSTNYNFSYK